VEWQYSDSIVFIVLSVIMLNGIMLNGIMLNGIMLNGIVLIVIMFSVIIKMKGKEKDRINLIFVMFPGRGFV
jgi:uncharacterized protein YybS (DUF2232 family)